jgi:hypothetical protein
MMAHNGSREMAAKKQPPPNSAEAPGVSVKSTVVMTYGDATEVAVLDQPATYLAVCRVEGLSPTLYPV